MHIGEYIPFLALDNGAGQMQRVAVEVGCRAKQETRANLFDPSAITSIPGSGSGVTLSHAADGGIQIVGTTGNGYAVFGNAVPAAQYVKLPESALTASIDAPAGVHMLFRLLKDGTTVEGGDLSTNSQITRDIAGLDYDSVSIGVQVAPNTTVNATVHPMLNAGTQALPFEAYKTVLPITGREGVEVRACGKNLLPPQQGRTANGVTLTVQEDGGLHLSGTCTADAGSPLIFAVLMGMTLNGQYTFSMGNAEAVGNHLQMRLLESASAQVSSVNTNFSANTANATNTFELDGQYVYGWAIRIGGGETYDVTLYPQLEAGGAATEYEPYRDLGGGEITPSAPLYGLPGAEDTVEVSVDGGVLVTRRTAVLEFDGTEDWAQVWGAGTARAPLSPAPVRPGYTEIIQTAVCSHYAAASQEQIYTAGTTNGFCIFYDSNYISIRDPQNAQTIDGWKAYLAAQAEAGTPVTVVYEIAEAATETPTAVDPIVPQSGQVNLFTDADALTATIYGSGWDTISDQTGLLATIAQLTARVAALEAAAVSTINNTTEG